MIPRPIIPARAKTKMRLGLVTIKGTWRAVAADAVDGRTGMVDRGPADKSEGGDPSRARLRQRFPTIEDLRHRARRRVPRFGFDFVDGGATDEHCVRRNTQAFQEVHLLPHYCVEGKVSMDTELLGGRYA